MPALNSPRSSDSMTSLACPTGRQSNTSTVDTRLTAREPSRFYANSSAPRRPADKADSVVLDCTMHNPGKLSWFGDWNDEKSRLSRTRDAGSRILKNEPSLDAKAAPDQKVWVWRWLMM